LRGQDVVIGVVDIHARPATQELVKQFETVGNTPGVVDIEAVLKRKPDVVLMDEIQGANPPGSRNERRWQDIQELLKNGVSVLSTLDVMNLESLNDAVADITGERPTETVPDHLLHDADEVELVDLTPRALVNRVERGVVVPIPLTKAQEDFYRVGNLSALREIAMREAATHVDEDLAEYRKEKRIEKPWAAKDRVLICISPTRSSLRLIRRGWRMGQRMHGDVITVYVKSGPIGDKEQKILDSDFALCSRLGIETAVLEGPVTETVIKFAREQSATAIILGHPERSRVSEIMRPSILSEVARELRTIDIIVVATELPTAAEH
jgi:two-component system sensor histidine kinase KdpD